ncbi:MAG: hypothetical protein ACR2PB_08625 [Desulfocapsaceae bacterium]
MPKRMILPIAFIIVTLVFVVKSFFNTYLNTQSEEERQQAESIKTIQEKREYDLKLQACIKQQKGFHDSLETKGELYSIENGKKIDNSFKSLSAECKMMIIRWEKESDSQTAKQKKNTTDKSS